jgi:hypothetical protein
MKTATRTPLIDTEQRLEEQLSRPSEPDVEAIARLKGDILILGVGGKMGPSLARLAARAAEESGVKKRIVGVARFSNEAVAEELEAHEIETIRCDLLDSAALARLPELENVIFMAARKFGTTGAEYRSNMDRAAGKRLSAFCGSTTPWNSGTAFCSTSHCQSFTENPSICAWA